MDSELIKKILKKVAKPKKMFDLARSLAVPPVLPPAATERQIQTAETDLGFELPAAYRQALLEIANGGFGPGYGIFGVEGGKGDFDGKSLVQVYIQAHTPGMPGYLPPLPEKVLPICNWGCGIYSVLDCSQPDAPVYFFNPDLHMLDDEYTAAHFLDAAGEMIWAFRPAISPVPAEPQEDDEPEANEGLPCLIKHKASFVEWLTAWGDNKDLWKEMEEILESMG